MNPAKVNLLLAIRAKGETNRKVIGANAKPGYVALYVTQLVKSGLIQFTGGGYFQITSQGCDYLDSLGNQTGARLAIG
jgi:predicted transcriptional regulator